LLTATSAVQAQNNDAKKPPEAGMGERPRHEPPPQAYEDCKGKKEGTVVQITTPREGKIAATCTNSPKGLFARPEHPPGPPPGREDAPPKK
jgi:hypothetical protein